VKSWPAIQLSHGCAITRKWLFVSVYHCTWTKCDIFSSKVIDDVANLPHHCSLSISAKLHIDRSTPAGNALLCTDSHGVVEF